MYLIKNEKKKKGNYKISKQIFFKNNKFKPFIIFLIP